MSAIATPISPPSPVVAPGPRRWSREEFYRLAELGFFDGQRAERIEGEIMVQSPQKWLHASTTGRVAEVLRSTLGAGFWVRMQLPLALGLKSDPEPDVSVVSGQRENYSDHPTAAVLIVEVSDSTLATDRTRKMSMYAAAGVPDYWIVNLIDGQLDIYRDTMPDTTQPSGHRYATVNVLSPSDTVTPAALPGIVIPVADLFS